MQNHRVNLKSFKFLINHFGEINMKLFLGAAVIAATSLVAISAQAGEKLRYKMQSTWGSQVAINGEAAVYFSNKVKEVSGGDVRVRFHEPNALVPSLEVWDAVKNGSVDAGFTSPGYHAGKIPAVSYFAAVPFGPGGSEYMGWMEYGGGNQLKEKIYGEYGLMPLNCGMHAPETSGWFRKKINKVEEMKGMKMRFFGLGAMVMTKLGVSTQLLAGGDIYPALEKGVIDATEFSMPTHDLSYGFYQLAKYNYFPGWHQQTSIIELLLNKKAWNGLTKTQQSVIKTSCDATTIWTFVRSDAKQVPAMRELEKKGVTFVTWPDSEIAKFRKAWEEVVKEKSASDPLFKEITASYDAFRKDYSIWSSKAYLKR
jgi:TRAP-type mannitol/chloroaromatic compound transport system substrate-binding protein